MYKQNLYLQIVIVIFIKRVNQAPLLMKEPVGLPNKIGHEPRLLMFIRTIQVTEEYQVVLPDLCREKTPSSRIVYQ